jgi:murein DD-endopeptidase MepM/ murein hydrolase activator NlpD
MRNTRVISLVAAVAVLIIGGAAVFFFLFEGEDPSLSLSPEPRAIGKQTNFTLSATDGRSGLREVRVEVVQGGRTASVLTESYPRGVHKVEKAVEIVPSSLGLQEGDATLRVVVRDRSWRPGGNRRVFEARTPVDTRPPGITVLSRFHYLNQGGAGLVVFSASEELLRSELEVGDLRFPCLPLQDRVHFSLFAVPLDASSKTPISLVAEDLAGNKARTSFPYRIKPKQFRKDNIQITDDFLNRVMPYFMDRDPSLRGEMRDVFLKVNNELRKESEAKIRELCRGSSPERLWKGPFHRMDNAKPMAGFGDRRSYFFGGREVDQQTHLGVDLASLALSPVKAANRGKVSFCGELGIYGNTVILDHGWGLYSMYSHLSRIDAKLGQVVEKEEILGITGSTGLAGGDHLHYAMLVSGVYVNPIEWWDPHWIEDNVDGKLGGAISDGR